MITITGDVKFSNLDIRYKNDFDFYARDLDLDPHLGGYQKIVNELVEDGSWQKINIGTSDLYCGKAKHYVENLNIKLKKNSAWLLDNYKKNE